MGAYGTVNIGGKTFIERDQNFPLEVSVTVNLSVQKIVLVLPGTADFWLKCLMRKTVVDGALAVRLFKFKLGNSDGNTWYACGGNGGTTDRVLDPLFFGDGQFPFVINPFIYYGASSSINMEIEDVSNNQPYTIYFDFRGSYLIPTSS